MSEYKLLLYDTLDETQQAIFKVSNLGAKVNQHYLMNATAIDYYLEYLGDDYANRSPILYKNEDPILILPSLSKKRELNFAGEPSEVMSTLKGDEYFKGVRIFIDALKKESLKSGEKIAKVRAEPIILKESLNTVKSITTLLRGYVNCDLSESSIKLSLRKSYKSLVNWGKRNLLIKVLDNNAIDFDLFMKFKALHLEASGRKTRSNQSWHYQFEMIKKGNGYLIAAFYNDKLVSGCFIMNDQYTALYGVAASDRQLMSEGLPLNHYTLWMSIMEAKQKGCKKFILGDVSDNRCQDIKSKNICLFKRGFATDVQVDTILNINITV